MLLNAQVFDLRLHSHGCKSETILQQNARQDAHVSVPAGHVEHDAYVITWEKLTLNESKIPDPEQQLREVEIT